MTKRAFLKLLSVGACAGCGGGRPCVPVGVVNIHLVGDSTQKGFDGSTAPSYTLAAKRPVVSLQDYFDDLLGMGTVLVTESGVGGSIAENFVAGTDGVNASWPTPAIGKHIVVANFGINDSHDSTRADYKAALTTICDRSLYSGIVVLETPNFLLPPTYDISDTAAAMREVAAEQTVQLIEIYDYCEAQADIVSLMPDETHPVSALYDRFTTNVTGPTLAPIVAKLRCVA